MRTTTKLISLATLVSASIVVGMILAGSLDLTRLAAAQKPAVSAPAAAAAPAPGRPPAPLALPSFADLVERVSPAVVAVTSIDIVKGEGRIPFHHFDEGGPFDFFLPPDHPRRGGEEDRKEMSGGTGFIIDPDGFILTNNHVVENATKVQVRVNGRDDYDAKVVGRDPATDLALLKIEGKTPFPTLLLGDSDRLRVGDWVMAIGNPLNFEKTVTVGVVSGKGRWAGLSQATSAFESLIQTDAAINFGNSGGPLLNTSGEVVGIDTAIANPRLAQNIGFAVPVNVAKRLLPQLKTGKVVRGFLGISIQTVNKDLQEAYGLKSAEGAIVESVEKGRPGEKAGLRHEDVIVRVDDHPVKTNRDLIDYVSSKAPGTKVTLTFIRSGKEQTTVATLTTRSEPWEEPQTEEVSEKGQKEKVLGLEISDLSPDLRRQYRIDREAQKGVLVTHVKPVSAASDAGLMEGDVILEVNGVEVGSTSELQAQLKTVPKNRWVRLYVLRSIPRAQKFIAAVKPE
ncbi:MAG: Do family serine endopeptidase [Acidithiobacillales bacterium]